ncbi:MAG: hypothetical protein ACREFW_11315 [Rhizomicrobium sp.]
MSPKSLVSLMNVVARQSTMMLLALALGSLPFVAAAQAQPAGTPGASAAATLYAFELPQNGQAG